MLPQGDPSTLHRPQGSAEFHSQHVVGWRIRVHHARIVLSVPARAAVDGLGASSILPRLLPGMNSVQPFLSLLVGHPLDPCLMETLVSLPVSRRTAGCVEGPATIPKSLASEWLPAARTDAVAHAAGPSLRPEVPAHRMDRRDLDPKRLSQQWFGALSWPCRHILTAHEAERMI